MEINNLNHLISQGREEFIEKTIQIDENGIILKDSIFDKISKLVFSNCIFKGGYIEFKNIFKDKFTVLFDNCSFEIELKFNDCSFNNLIFNNTLKINKIKVFY